MRVVFVVLTTADELSDSSSFFYIRPLLPLFELLLCIHSYWSNFVVVVVVDADDDIISCWLGLLLLPRMNRILLQYYNYFVVDVHLLVVVIAVVVLAVVVVVLLSLPIILRPIYNFTPSFFIRLFHFANASQAVFVVFLLTNTAIWLLFLVILCFQIYHRWWIRYSFFFLLRPFRHYYCCWLCSYCCQWWFKLWRSICFVIDYSFFIAFRHPLPQFLFGCKIDLGVSTSFIYVSNSPLLAASLNVPAEDILGVLTLHIPVSLMMIYLMMPK